MKNRLTLWNTVLPLILMILLSGTSCFAYTAQYKQVVKIGGGEPEMTADFWMKDNNMRVESAPGGQKMIMITREDGVYNYIPSQNMVTKMPVSQSPMGGGSATYVKSPDDYMKYLKDIGALKTGSETIDGYECDIYEYEDATYGPKVDATVWLWREKSFPVKMISKTQYGTSEILFKDIKIGEPISDSMFEVPKGAKVVDLGSMKSAAQSMLDSYKD